MPGEDGRGERAQGTRGFENGPSSGSLGWPCRHVRHRRRLGRQPSSSRRRATQPLHPAPDSTCGRCLGPGALRHPANPAATVLQERDELAFGLRITLNVALRHGETETGRASSCTSRAPPTCETRRAARVIKVRRPECDEHPSIFSEV